MIAWRDGLSLFALVLVPALVVFLIHSRRRRQQALGQFVAAGLWPTVAPDVDLRRRNLRDALRTLAVLFAVLALAGPMWGFHWEEVKREGIDLVVAIDTSRSMLSTDVKPNRLARAKLAVQDLLGRLKGDRIGLVAFAGTAFAQCPLTLDRTAFSQSLEAIEAGIIPRGGTSLPAAIETSLDTFEGRQGKNQALVLITDGESNEGDVKAATQKATERGIKIYTVGIGTADGELIPGEDGGYVKDRSGQVVKSRLDEETLKQVAVDTGGVYLHAAGPSMGLTELYDDYIAKMENKELASTLEKRYEQRFQLPLLLAILCLLAEWVVGERRPAATPRRFWQRGRAAPGRVA
jgi:Ca-activated chloride channel homolog